TIEIIKYANGLCFSTHSESHVHLYLMSETELLFIGCMGMSTNGDIPSVAVCANGNVTYGFYRINLVYMCPRARAIISQHVINLMFRVNTYLP
ncbi:hypothetical protein K7A37_11620, partial [Escherichia fergusonii]|uniref:hypothetical protein n=1 Tax=Escherichia fergusonii TaxID=564 RepID=UPI001C9A4A70|nr:hypothetical protein [Escherichia fergusonii]